MAKLWSNSKALSSDAAELQLVDLEAFGQEPESVADVVEIFEVEVVSDAEDNGQSEEPELTLEDRELKRPVAGLITPCLGGWTATPAFSGRMDR